MLDEGAVCLKKWSHARGLMICVRKEGLIRVRNRWEEGGKKEIWIKENHGGRNSVMEENEERRGI
jgi:hypothetical protein